MPRCRRRAASTHNHEHVIKLVAVTAIRSRCIAALYHDAVYIQVDHGPPGSMAAEIERVLETAELAAPGVSRPDGRRPRVTGRCARTCSAARSATWSSRTPSGLNEFASALVASIQLTDALDREQRIAVSACIEQTIPFRVDPVTRAARSR